MNAHLDNPVYQALISGDAHLSLGNENVKYFDQQVSPFAGFSEDYCNGFNELHDLLPAGRKILCATRRVIEDCGKWKLLQSIPGLQFVYFNNKPFEIDGTGITSLNESNVGEMMQLAELTKPGPFRSRTIEFGHYFGIFENGKLAAMAGQRLHLPDHTEISAVCTHPEYVGKGFARSLTAHQVNLILHQNKTPFLHVRADNDRAISLYERLGFTPTGHMNFYVLQKQ